MARASSNTIARAKGALVGRLPEWVRTERLVVSALAFTVVTIPLMLAALIEWPSSDHGPLYQRLAVLWGFGFVGGLTVVMVQAFRGRLVVRDPAKVAANRTRNAKLAVALAPLAVTGAVILGRFSADGIDIRVLLGILATGFLTPLMPVLLWIAFRVVRG